MDEEMKFKFDIGKTLYYKTFWNNKVEEMTVGKRELVDEAFKKPKKYYYDITQLKTHSEGIEESYLHEDRTDAEHDYLGKRI